MTVEAPTARRKEDVRQLQLKVPVAVFVAFLIHLAAAAPSAMAAMWSVTPPGKWSCSSTGNGCLTATGFNPGVRHWGMFANGRGNCVNYAAYRLIRNGAPQVTGLGNANNWGPAVRRQLGPSRVNRKPAVGAIAWWDGVGVLNGGGFGHVAYVEKVSGGTVYLSDSSWNLGSSRWTVAKGSSRWPDAFLHIKDRPKPKPKKSKPKPKPAPTPVAPPAPPAPAPAPSSPSPQPAAKTTNRLSNDQRLLAAKNESLRSADGRYRLVMQSDSNLVLYGPTGRPLWASNTVGRGAHHLRMQGDGNLVIYTASNRPIWASNTPRHYKAHLVVQNDGNVVIYNSTKPIWATGTNGRR